MSYQPNAKIYLDANEFSNTHRDGEPISAWDGNHTKSVGAVHLPLVRTDEKYKYVRLGAVYAENPVFTGNTAVNTNYLSNYGWNTNIGWVVSTNVINPANLLSGSLIRRRFLLNSTTVSLNKDTFDNEFDNLTSTELIHISNFSIPNADFIGFEYTGWLVVDTSGEYTFAITSGDGSDFAIFLDGKWLIITDNYGYDKVIDYQATSKDTIIGITESTIILSGANTATIITRVNIDKTTTGAIYETGGTGDGTALYLTNGVLYITAGIGNVISGTVETSYSIPDSIILNDITQIIASVRITTAERSAILFVNGIEVANTTDKTTVSSVRTLSGPNPAGTGNVYGGSIRLTRLNTNNIAFTGTIDKTFIYKDIFYSHDVLIEKAVNITANPINLTTDVYYPIRIRHHRQQASEEISNLLWKRPSETAFSAVPFSIFRTQQNLIVKSEGFPDPRVSSYSGRNINFTYEPWEGVNKISNEHNCWISNTTPSDDYPVLFRIEYPYPVSISYYEITSRGISINTRFPTIWVLQGSIDGILWVNLEVERTESLWNAGETKTFSDGVNTDNNEYKYYQLLITGSRVDNNTAITTTGQVAIGNWSLYTKNGSTSSTIGNYIDLGTQTWLKSYETPKFISYTDITPDYQSVYGWNTDDGWRVSANSNNLNGTDIWKAFNKTTIDTNDCWLSTDNGAIISDTNPQWLQIEYPYEVSISSYTISLRSDDTLFPTRWRLEGSTDGITWIDLENLNTGQTASVVADIEGQTFSTTNTGFYKYFRLFITGASANSNSVAIGNWSLFTRPGFTAVGVIRFWDVKTWQRWFDFGNGANLQNILYGKRANNIGGRFEIHNKITLEITDPYVVPVGNGWHIVVARGTSSEVLDVWANPNITLEPKYSVLGSITDFTARTLANNWIGRSNWSSDFYSCLDIRETAFYDYSISNSDLAKLVQHLTVKYDILTVKSDFMNNGLMLANSITETPNLEFDKKLTFGGATSGADSLKIQSDLDSTKIGILDTINVGTTAVCALGTRHLFNDYEGSHIRARRESDNREADIRFDKDGHIQEILSLKESPEFTSNTSVDTDYLSKYGWETNAGWVVSATSFNANVLPGMVGGFEPWKALNKSNGDNDCWISSDIPTLSIPVYIRIEYPYKVSISSYEITSRNSSTRRLPTRWKLQGSNNIIEWNDLEEERTSTVSDWPAGKTKTFPLILNINTVEYKYYQLLIYEAKHNDIDPTVAPSIGNWSLYTYDTLTRPASRTAWMENPKFTDTTSYLTTWTPIVASRGTGSIGTTDFQPNQDFEALTGGGEDSGLGSAWNAFDKLLGLSTGGDRILRTLANGPVYVGLKYPMPVVLQSCSYSAGRSTNDHERVPTHWTIDGSDDGEEWHIVQQYIEAHTDYIPTRSNFFDFSVDTIMSYRYWRMNVSQVRVGTAVQFGELIFRTSLISSSTNELYTLEQRSSELTQWASESEALFVSTLYDQSGNNNHFKQNEYSKQPILRPIQEYSDLIENPEFTSPNTYKITWTKSTVTYGTPSTGSTTWSDSEPTFLVISNIANNDVWKAFNKIHTGESPLRESLFKNGVVNGVNTDRYRPVWLGIRYPKPVLLQSYSFTLGNTETVAIREKSTPRDWTIDGSNDGTHWTTVQRYNVTGIWYPSQDSASDIMYDFTTYSEVGFTHWRMNIESVTDGNFLQIAELIFRTREPHDDRMELFFESSSFMTSESNINNVNRIVSSTRSPTIKWSDDVYLFNNGTDTTGLFKGTDTGFTTIPTFIYMNSDFYKNYANDPDQLTHPITNYNIYDIETPLTTINMLGRDGTGQASHRTLIAFSGGIDDTVRLELNNLLTDSSEGILDVLSCRSNTAAAFALKRLFSEYTGPQIRIRRPSDNVEADVWFNSYGVPVQIKEYPTFNSIDILQQDDPLAFNGFNLHDGAGEATLSSTEYTGDGIVLSSHTFGTSEKITIPAFTDNETVIDDTLFDNSGWIASASSTLGTGFEPWRGLNRSTIDSGDVWHSAQKDMTIEPHWLQVKSPEEIVILSYNITTRNSSGTDPTWFPTSWQLQGSNNLSGSWTDLHVVTLESTDTWGANETKKYTTNINVNRLAFIYLRLLITSSRQDNSFSVSNNSYVAIGDWQLFVENKNWEVNVPTKWNLQASNNNSKWVIIQSFAKDDWANYQMGKEFTFQIKNAKSAYKYWRMNITRNGNTPRMSMVDYDPLIIVPYRTQYVAIDKLIFTTKSASNEPDVNLSTWSGYIAENPKMTSLTTHELQWAPAVGSDGATSTKFTGEFSVFGSQTFTSRAGTQYSLDKAFDKDVSQEPASAIFPIRSENILGMYYPRAVELLSYALMAHTGVVGRAPKDWMIEGSNDGTQWFTLDTRVNETGWVAFEIRNYNIAVPKNYERYQMRITSNNGDGSYFQVTELIFRTDNTSRIVTWYDQGHGKFHLTQSEPTYQPLLTYDEVLDNWAINVGGANIAMSTGNIFSKSWVTDMILIAKTRELSRVNNFGISFNGTSTGGSDRFSIHIPWSNGVWYFDPKDASTNRVQSAGGITAVGEVANFYAYKSSLEAKNGLNVNGFGYISNSYTEASARKGMRISGGNHNFEYMITMNNSDSPDTFAKDVFSLMDERQKFLLKGGDEIIRSIDGVLYKYHVFKESGELALKGEGIVECLIVAGGGGGGCNHAGGGGAGGLIYIPEVRISKNTNITVGAGGIGGGKDENGANLAIGAVSRSVQGRNGGDSSFGNIIAKGGGGGGNRHDGNSSDNQYGKSGGSGGGSGGYASALYNTWQGGSGISGQGNNGGSGMGFQSGGGGGGAGEEGENGGKRLSGTVHIAGKGGDGLGFTQFADIGINYGTRTSEDGWFAGGGGGSIGNSTDPLFSGVGGKGGGGVGGDLGTNGITNTGGGGGGGRGSSFPGFNGGSGVVIVRYKISNATWGILPKIWGVAGESVTRVGNYAPTFGGTIIEELIDSKPVWRIGATTSYIDFPVTISHTTNIWTVTMAFASSQPVSTSVGTLFNQVLPPSTNGHTNHYIATFSQHTQIAVDEFVPSGGGFGSQAVFPTNAFHNQSVLTVRRNGSGSLSIFYNGTKLVETTAFTENYNGTVPDRMRLGSRGYTTSDTSPVGLAYAAFAVWDRALSDAEIEKLTYDELTVVV